MITSTDTKLIYDGDGSTTAFPYTFGIIEASNIKVIRIDSDGSEHLLDADYYVDVANGNVNYPGYAPGSAPPVEEQPPVLPVNSKLCIYRSVPQTQITDLPGTYPLSVIEASLDKLTMLLQEVSEITGRSFKLSIGNGAGIDMVLPVEAGKTFKWAADGKSLVLADDPAVVYEATVTLYAAVQSAIVATEAARDAAILARNNANTSAINAANSEDAAEASAIAAANHEANALSYKIAAETAATNADNSESATHADAVAAALSESNALNYKNSAQTSAGNAAISESNALSYKNSAEASATAADASADAAALAEGNALASKNSAQTSAGNAATSETNAGNSATAAHSSELAADASANAAALSESNALSYKNTAQTSAGNAATSESNALSYKNAAQTSADNAASSEGSALAYKNAAQGSAEAAAASALLAQQYAAIIDPDAYEPALGSPDVDGKVLSSTTSGVRSWIFPTVDLSNYYTKTQTNALIPTTLPASDVSAWAKAATKPSYTYSEVGAAAYSHGHTVSQISDFPASMPASDVYSWAKAATKPTYTNIEVGAAATSHNHTKSEISDFPSSMPASDVYAWAKASSKPSYTASEVGAEPALGNPASDGLVLKSTVGGQRSWGTVTGGQYLGSATSKAIAYNAQTIGENITIPGAANAYSCGPITINDGYTVTIEDGGLWQVF